MSQGGWRAREVRVRSRAARLSARSSCPDAQRKAVVAALMSLRQINKAYSAPRQRQGIAHGERDTQGREPTSTRMAYQYSGSLRSRPLAASTALRSSPVSKRASA